MNTVGATWRLTQPADNGVLWLAAAEVDALCAAGDAAGLHCMRVVLGDLDGKAALLERLADALAFPDWFGHNWDALADCLGDLSWLPASGYLLVLEDCRRFARRSPGDYGILLEILADAAGTWRARAVPFRVFLSMAAPHGPLA
ncbi:MAG TPA: barstar family protein [Gammaproteobacteria bacterium]|nr:barstar family protein [Gammaproteobacteria bacterium]HRP86580.1 barstar family protein [Gammaproteobacteria bacterium]